MSGDSGLSLSQRLHALAQFLPAIESPEFRVGSWDSPSPREDGSIFFPTYSFGEVASSLHHVIYDASWVLPNFDWPEWMGTEEAMRLRDDPEYLARATPDQLARLLTVLVRQERFCEGSFAAAFEAGLVVRILRRASALAADHLEKGTA